MSFKIAIASTSVTANVEINCDAILKAMEHAASNHADLVLTSECALSGYAPTHLNSASEYDFELIDAHIKRIQKKAQHLKIWTIVGTAVANTTHKLPLNSQIVIDPSGEIVAQNDKNYLSNNEQRSWFSAGDRQTTFVEIEGIKFGFAICIEAVFPHYFQQIAQSGAECILFSTTENKPLFQTLLKGHAAAFACWIAASEHQSTQKASSNMLINPNGDLECSIHEQASSSVQYFEIDKSDERFSVQLNLARPWRKQMREQANPNLSTPQNP
jgi:predicted amidohydrolase